jgi:FkbM family methyltransferase
MSKLSISKLFLAARSVGNFLSFGGKFYFPKMILRRVFRFSKSEVWVPDFDGNLKMCLQLSDHMQRRIFWMGYYSSDIVAILKEMLKPGMVVLDVGANIGEITLVSAQLVGSDGAVISFEPVSAIADKLVEHVQINGLSQIVINRYGLGKEMRENMPIYVSCGQRSADPHNGLASLYGQAEGAALIGYIDVSTLDESVLSLQLSRVDLIKIDIEGGEYDCLLGAKDVLKKYRPMLIVEVQEFTAKKAGWNTGVLFQYLEGFGYEFFTIGKQGALSKLDRHKPIGFQNVFCKVRDEA